MANAGRSTRDLNLSHPASYTALTRAMLVPAKESEGTISLFLIPQRHGVGDHTLRDVMQLLKVAKVSFQLETSSYYSCSFLTRTLVISQRHRGITRCNLLNTLPVLEPCKILSIRHFDVVRSFLLSRSFQQSVLF